jgi:ribosomal protein S18 acetylase RimI-like enzyme
MNGEFSGVQITTAVRTDLTALQAIDTALGLSDPPGVSAGAVEHGRMLVARRDEQIVGYLRYGFFWDGELPYIQMLRVTPSQQRSGIGRRLVAYLEASSSAAGLEWLLSSTEETNYTSTAFHEALGFVRCGTLDINRDGTPEVFFKKRLIEEG